MQKFTIILILIILTITSVYAKESREIFTFEFGMNHILEGDVTSGHIPKEIQSPGYSLGFLVPINFESINMHVRLSVSSFQIRKTFPPTIITKGFYHSYNEELLIGKNINFGNYNFLPQLSIGRSDDAAYLYYLWYPTQSESEISVTRDHYWTTGLALTFKYNFRKTSTGMIIQIIKGVYDVHYFGEGSNLKFKASVILSINAKQ